jgi:hypothetical protein
LERQCVKILSQGIIHLISSAFSSPVLLIKKDDGTWQFCIDYRALYAITIKDKFLIPVVEELLDELHGGTLLLEARPPFRLSPSAHVRRRCGEDRIPDTPGPLRVPSDALQIDERTGHLPSLNDILGGTYVNLFLFSLMTF